MLDDIFKIKNEILSLVNDYSDINFKQKDFVPGLSEVPVSGKVIGSLELKNMVEASLDGWLTTGRFNEQFEKKLANFLGIKCLLTVNSGSSANLIAFSTLTSPKLKERAIQKGDEVISVAAGFPTTVNPIIQFGAVPVFIDVKIPTYNIDENLIESAITKKTKAVMLAHTLGNPFNVQKIKEICENNEKVFVCSNSVRIKTYIKEHFSNIFLYDDNVLKTTRRDYSDEEYWEFCLIEFCLISMAEKINIFTNYSWISNFISYGVFNNKFGIVNPYQNNLFIINNGAFMNLN
jgi:hypothetical protein